MGIAITVLLTGQYSRRMEIVKRNLRELTGDLESLTGSFTVESGAMHPSDTDSESMQALSNHVSELRDGLSLLLPQIMEKSAPDLSVFHKHYEIAHEREA